MSLRELCHRWLARDPRSSKPGKPRRGLRLTIEPLEDRTVPSNFTAAGVADLIADINAANQAGGSNSIVLTTGTTFTLTAVNNTTDGPTGLPVIAATGNLTIVGNGDTIERKASGSTPAFRLLDVAAGTTLTLENLTLQGGLALGGLGVTSAEGGGIYSQGALILTGVTVQNNSAQGIDGPTGAGGGPAAGGGIYSCGSLTLEGCTLQNNQAVGGAGGQGYHYRDHFGDSGHYPGGNGGDGLGGGLCLAGGTASLHNSTVTGNKALGGHGGGGGTSAGLGEGGGVFIAPAASVCLDAFTQANVNNNAASTADDNIFGTFTTCS
jgi:hypothetical protein